MFIVVSPEIGNDQTGIVNSYDKPFASITEAVKKLVGIGGTIILSPGFHNVDTINIEYEKPEFSLEYYSGYVFLTRKKTPHSMISIIGSTCYNTIIRVKETINVKNAIVTFHNVSLFAKNLDIIKTDHSFFNISSSYIMGKYTDKSTSDKTLINCNNTVFRCNKTAFLVYVTPDCTANITCVNSNYISSLSYSRFYTTIIKPERKINKSKLILVAGSAEYRVTYNNFYIALRGTTSFSDIILFDMSTKGLVVDYFNVIVIKGNKDLVDKTDNLIITTSKEKQNIHDLNITSNALFKNIQTDLPKQSVFQNIQIDIDKQVTNSTYMDHSGMGTMSLSTNTRVINSSKDQLRNNDYYIVYNRNKRGIFKLNDTINGRNIVFYNNSEHSLILKDERGEFLKVKPKRTLKLIYVSELSKWMPS